MSPRSFQNRSGENKIINTGLHASKRLVLSGFLLITFISAVAFLVKSSRPTADEYLLAPLLHGFYIDANTPNNLLFLPSDSVLSNFFSAVLAAYQLGWDSPLNFAVFQMIPATLLNFIGKTSTSILCIFYFTLAFLAIKSSIAANYFGKRERSTVNLMILLGLMFSILITDFGSEKEYFGIYSLTGIRFGLYWLQPLLAFCAFAYIVKAGDEKKNVYRKKLFLFFVVPTFCSLWTSIFWIILISFYLLLLLIEIRHDASMQKLRNVKMQAKGLALSIFTALLGMIYILKPAVNAGRFIGEDGQIFDRIEQNGSNVLEGFLRIIPFWKLGFWQITFASPVVIGFCIGVMISRLRVIQLSREVSIQFSSGKKVALPLASSALLATMVTYTFVFHLMEFFTYPAWWHRGSPSSWGYFAGLVLGLEIGPKILRNFKRAGMVFVVSVSIFVLYKVPYVIASFRSLDAFAANWDQGDLLGNGTPVQNNADYICLEIAQISPKELKCQSGEV